MRRHTIVVVEDEPMNRLMAVDAFEDAGFDVVDFGHADEAIRFAEHEPDAVSALFTDINIPGDRDGIELAVEFSERWPKTLVVVTSGCFGAAPPIELPTSALFVAKPWTTRALVGMIRTELNVPRLPVF